MENWIKKYDEEMGEKQVWWSLCVPGFHVLATYAPHFLQDELEMLEEQFTEEKKQLKELEEKLGVIQHWSITDPQWTPLVSVFPDSEAKVRCGHKGTGGGSAESRARSAGEGEKDKGCF